MKKEHDALVEALSREGAEVVHVGGSPTDPKAMFTRDNGLIVPGGAIICRMGPVGARPGMGRRGEEAHASRVIAGLGMPILRTIHGTGLFEGGSFALLNGTTAVAGLSFRQNDEAARQIEEVLAVLGIRLLRVPLAGHALHIDGQLVMVDEDLALINIERTPYWFLDTLRDLKIRWVEVHHADNPRVLNCLAVRPGKVLLAINNGDGTAKRLVDHGVEVGGAASVRGVPAQRRRHPLLDPAAGARSLPDAGRWRTGAAPTARSIWPSATTKVAHNLALRDVSKLYGSVAALDDVSLTSARPVPDPARAVGLGQDHDADGDRRLRGADQRAACCSTARGSRTCRRRSAISAWCSRATRCFRISPCAQRRLPAQGARRAEADRATRSATRSTSSSWRAGRRCRASSPAASSSASRSRARWSSTPHLLLLDEPLSALDKKLRADMQWELKAPPARRAHLRLRDARPGGGAVDVRPGRHPARRPVRAARRAERALRAAGDALRRRFLGKSNFLGGQVDALVGTTSPTRWRRTATCRRPRPRRRVGGRRALVALRPEKLTIAAQRAPDGANRVGGEIATWNYYGTNFHFLVRTDSLGELMVTAPAWRCEVEPEIGRRVELGWSDASVVVVAPD